VTRHIKDKTTVSIAKTSFDQQGTQGSEPPGEVHCRFHEETAGECIPKAEEGDGASGSAQSWIEGQRRSEDSWTGPFDLLGGTNSSFIGIHLIRMKWI
jgi:hypothetical protein